MSTKASDRYQFSMLSLIGSLLLLIFSVTLGASALGLYGLFRKWSAGEGVTDREVGVVSLR